MEELLERIKRVPWVAHLLRANQRFTARLGNQFGAAITYFSVLAIVPILMLGLSILGFVLVQVPALRASVTATITDLLSQAPGGLQDQATAVIDTYLNNYGAIGIFGLLSAIYAGAGWIGNLKGAVRTQWKPEFDLVEHKRNLVLEILANLGILLALLVLILLTSAISTLATTFSDTVSSLLGLDRIAGGILLVRIPPILISVAVSWLLFMFVYRVLPQDPIGLRARMKGSLIAAVGFTVLQYVVGLLFGVFAGNAAASVFGPVIVLMLFLALFARLTLFMAAWIATTEQPALGTDAGVDAITGDPEGPATPPRLRAGEPATALGAAVPVDGKTEWVPGAGQDVPQKVAVRSVRVGMGAGYLTGTATGIGLGATVAALVGAVATALRARRERRAHRHD